MSTDTTIQITKQTRELLKKARIHPRETYNELLTRLASKRFKPGGRS